MNDFFVIALYVLSIGWHEMGHILWMKKLGIFKGLKINWHSIQVLVNKEANVQVSFLEECFVYLSGIVFSFLVYPIWVSLGYPGIYFIVIQVCVSIMDFYFLGKLILFRISFNKIEGMKSG